MLNAFINDEQLVEGIIAAFGMAIMIVYLRNILEFPIGWETATAWLVVWFMRKIGSSAYISIKRKYKLNDYKITLLPKPGIYPNTSI